MSGRRGPTRPLATGLVVLLVVLLTACGARTAPSGPTVARSGTPDSPAGPASPVDDDPATPSEVASPGGAVSEGDAAPARAAPEDWPSNSPHVNVRVSPECAAPGQLVTADISGPSKATYGLTVFYSDGSAHGTIFIGYADEQGRYTWRFPVAADAPEGPADVIVMASGPDGQGHAGSHRSPFTVVHNVTRCSG